MKKIVFSIFLVMVLVLSMSIGVFAVEDIEISSTKEFNAIGGKIIGAIKAAAIIVAVAVLIYVGVKFMLAAPGEKAQLKTALIPYIVGAVIIFAAVPIVTIIQNIGTNMGESTTTTEGE